MTVGTWLRWELGRRVRITVGLRLIVVFLLVQVVVLIVGGLIIILSKANAFREFAESAQLSLNLDPGGKLFRRLVDVVARRFTSTTGIGDQLLAIGGMIYGLLLVIELAGLMVRRRWAEYLVLVVTVALIPLELDEVIGHPEPLKGIVVGINVAIVVYLISRRRLFIDRPPRPLPA